MEHHHGNAHSKQEQTMSLATSQRRHRAGIRGMAAVACMLLMAGCASAPQPPARTTAPGTTAPAAATTAPYLPPTAMPQTVDVLPPAPTAGSPRYEADRQVFLRTRALQGSPRWKLATADVRTSIPAMLQDFSCAAGTTLDADRMPRLVALLERAAITSEHVTDAAKAANKRLRPFQIDDGPVCQPKEDLAHSFDYPSGHSTWGWMVGLVLAELEPDRSTDILVRARAYADSRVVCGAHNLSAVQAGAVNATSIIAALHGSPAFRTDLDAARAELAAQREAAPLAGAGCAAEQKLVTPAPY
jgi:acid phosphatase (class A)